jgi:AAA+ ATPase superfamily predicted ATPase
MFVNREKGLSTLDERCGSGRAEFVILYGRRRIGKSELIEQFLKDKKGLRLLAREQSEALQLRDFSEELAEFFKDEVLATQPLTNWDSFFTYIAQKAEKERFVLAIDEFPYLVQENRAIPSILQGYWDRKLRHSRIFLILCGSSIGMMESLLGGKSPLYGRRTGQMLLRPFSFQQSLALLGRDIEKAVRAYSVFGGTPAYLIEYDKTKDIYLNIKEKVLKEDAFMFRDAEFLLRGELREPRFYFSILSSIARGNTRLSEIVNDTGLNKGVVVKYLSVLSDLHLVERMVPVTEKHPEKSRKGVYRLLDNYFRFWFRYVRPAVKYVEKGDEDYILRRLISPSLNSFTGFSFEKVAEEVIEELGRRSWLPFVPSRIGKWWHKAEEIDVVALNDETRDILFCEVKWSDNVNAETLLADLKRKSTLVEWNSGKRNEHYCIIARTFKRRTSAAICIDVNDIKTLLLPK